MKKPPVFIWLFLPPMILRQENRIRGRFPGFESFMAKVMADWKDLTGSYPLMKVGPEK